MVSTCALGGFHDALCLGQLAYVHHVGLQECTMDCIWSTRLILPFPGQLGSSWRTCQQSRHSRNTLSWSIPSVLAGRSTAEKRLPKAALVALSSARCSTAWKTAKQDRYARDPNALKGSLQRSAAKVEGMSCVCLSCR